MNKTILISGGTGFVGEHLTSFLVKRGYHINILSRQKMQSTDNVRYFQWDIDNEFIEPMAFEDVEAIINLAGANISQKRWTPQRKKEIVDSRVKPLDLLYKCIWEKGYPINTLISSSAVGYYGTATSSHIFTEEDANGSDFLSKVCLQWEQAAKRFESLVSNVVILRKGVIIGKGGGFWQKIASLVKIGVNPTTGNGLQYVPWIGMGDLMALYDCLLAAKNINGIFNAVATEQPTMNEMTMAFFHHFDKKNVLPNVPKWIVQLLFGEMPSILLYGSRVSNRKIMDYGFQLGNDNIEKALR